MSGWTVPSPTLAVVSGPPGAGKTTLAHALAAAVGCPAVCRDEIKEGMVHTLAGGDPGSSDLDLRTMATFFDVLRLLLGAGVSVVAEAAYQDRLWRPGLEPLRDLATIRVIRCTVAAEVAHDRVARRLTDTGSRAAHDDRRYLGGRTAAAAGDGFGWVTLPAPTLRVDTSDGYAPPLAEIVAFVTGA
jgi:predicted kinase